MQEERAVAEIAGYKVDFLGFGEPFVRSGFASMTEIFDPSRDPSADPAWRNVYAALASMMDSHVSLVLAPIGCGDHIDHRMVNRIASTYLAEHSDITMGFYEDLPYAAELSESEIASKVKDVCGKRLKPVVVGGDIGAKLELLRVYESQLDNTQIECVRNYWNRQGGERIWLPS
jgi:LmbE family N-acetylglucosaminyl deacetylase